MTTTHATVERQLLFVKILYFLFFAAVGGYFVYLFIYYASIGLTGAQMGLISAVGTVIGLAAAPLWGMLSDRLAVTRPLFIISTFGSIVTVFLLSTARSFGAILAISIFGSFFTGPTMTLLDSTTLVLLGQRREQYGRQRLWGSVGYIITSFFVGRWLDSHGTHWIFYIYIAIMCVFLVVSFGLPIQRTKIPVSLGKGVMQLLRHRNWGFFAIAMMLLSVGMYAQMSFLGVYLVKLGGKESLVGTVGAVGAIIEVPFMYIAPGLLRRFGNRLMLSVSFITYSFRYLLYALMKSPVWAVPIAGLNGFCYGFMQTSSIAFVDDITPTNMKGTAMGLLSAVNSLGNLAGGPLDGWLLDTFGGSGMYSVTSALAGIGAGLLWLTRPKAGLEKAPPTVATTE